MIADLHSTHNMGSSLGVERRGVERLGGLKVTTLYSGEYYATDRANEMIETILGSCVAACMHDPISKVGGMNHFLLPDNNSNAKEIEGSARYGVFAMEQLINSIMQLGGLKQRLEVKVFGGGNVINNSAMIGSKNVAFVRDFLRKEGMRICGGDLGDNYPRRVRFCPDSGKAMMLKLQRKSDLRIIEEEKKFASALATKPVEGEIELF